MWLGAKAPVAVENAAQYSNNCIRMNWEVSIN